MRGVDYADHFVIGGQVSALCSEYGLEKALVSKITARGVRRYSPISFVAYVPGDDGRPYIDPSTCEVAMETVEGTLRGRAPDIVAAIVKIVRHPNRHPGRVLVHPATLVVDGHVYPVST